MRAPDHQHWPERQSDSRTTSTARFGIAGGEGGLVDRGQRLSQGAHLRAGEVVAERVEHARIAERLAGAGGGDQDGADGGDVVPSIRYRLGRADGELAKARSRDYLISTPQSGGGFGVILIRA